MNGNACESFEVHISALMDGEATTADTMSLLDHLPDCAPCRQFYRQARELQEVVDERPVAPGSTESTERRAGELGLPLLLHTDAEPAEATGATAAVVSIADAGKRRGRMREAVPRWVWALAAGLLLAVGFGLGNQLGAPRAVSPYGDGGELRIDLGADAGSMSEERFVALTVELLRADRVYRRQMSELLRRVEDSGDASGYDGELAAWRDESPSATLSEEGGSRGMGEFLNVSPMPGIY